MFYGGVHQISKMTTAKLGSRIHLNTPVNTITWDKYWPQVRTKTSAGTHSYAGIDRATRCDSLNGRCCLENGEHLTILPKRSF